MAELLNKEEWATVLRLWKTGHGQERGEFGGVPIYVVPVNRAERRAMYRHLMLYLVSKFSYEKSDLRSNVCITNVVNATIPLGWEQKKKLASWDRLATEDWQVVVDEEFEEGIPEAPPKKLKYNASGKKAEKYVAPRNDEIAPEGDLLDRSKLRMPPPKSVIDDSIDIFADDDEAE